ncbi:MAG: 2-C-methyl-D-erythritol 2,4-cyclodiphosphate synthase [Bacteroidetes bacterium]|jgi:2-C-methyl-D-erythritol 2,4-cyclodiphosphate synthase|nr:2-C-methyl-D-erythritol 2,4-cyclodiphosphate synthase [Bacteroidota bacterium]
MNIRIGFGFDVHTLVEGRELWLGGIKLEHTKGADGHSDADVLIHAICDALLGAANMRDIGFHFSNTDAKYKNIDSKILLKETVALLESKNYRIGNVDATLCLEQPKINPHIPAMQAVLAPLMKISTDAISIKATTNEGLGYVGSENGVNAYAVALIEKID